MSSDSLIEKEREREHTKKMLEMDARDTVNTTFYVRQLQKTLVCHVSPDFIAGTIHEN